MSVQILFWLVSLAFALPQISARGSSAGLIPIQSGSGFYKPEIFDASNVNSTKRDLPHLQKRAWQGCWLNLPPIPEADISYLETLWQDSAITWDLWLMKPFYYYWFTLSDGTEFCVYNRNNVYTNMQYWEMGWGVSYESCCSDSTCTGGFAYISSDSGWQIQSFLLPPNTNPGPTCVAGINGKIKYGAYY